MRLSFSKFILLSVMITYFIGLIVGIFIVIHILTNYPDNAVEAYLGMLSYIGAPVAIAIGFYSWKAKHENVAKINKEDLEENEE